MILYKFYFRLMLVARLEEAKKSCPFRTALLSVVGLNCRAKQNSFVTLAYFGAVIFF
jgi:hypothetical protein